MPDGFCQAVMSGKRLVAILFFAQLFILPFASSVFAESLQEVIRKAIVENPEVQEKWYAFQASSDEHRRSKSAYKPRVDLSSRLGLEWLESPSATSELQPAEVSLQLTQMLYDGFATRNEVRKFGHTRLVRLYEFYDVTESIALDVSRAYLDVLKYRSLLALAEANYAQHRAIFDQVRQRVEAGISRGVDLEQATGRLALADSNRVTEMTNLHDVNARYLRLVGSLPPQELEEPGTIFDGLVPDTLDRAFREAFRSNPAFIAALENVEVADAELDQQKSAYQPSLQFRARHAFGNDRANIEGSSDESVVELVLNYNLFQGGATTATVSRFASQTVVAQKQLERTCRSVRQTLDIGFNDVRQLGRQIELLDRHQTSISNARDAYRNQFDIGQRTLLDLLDTENEFFLARRAYVNAAYDFQLAHARTIAAMGQLLERLDIRQADLPYSEALELKLRRINPDVICPPLTAAMPERPKAALELPAPPRPAPSPAPLPKTVELTLKKRLDIHFDYRESVISPQYDPQLGEMADFLKRYPQTIVTINGHTDNVGGAAYNRTLSQARAEAVRQRLVEEYQIPPEQIFISWFGFSQPKSDNLTSEGRAQNRRTEVLAALLEKNLDLPQSGDSPWLDEESSIALLFPYRGAEVTDEQLPQLQAIADFLKQHPDIIVTLNGQTDNVGSRKYNLELSRTRAEVIRNRLIDSYGSDPDQIFMTWSAFRNNETAATDQDAARQSRRTLVKFTRIVDNLASIKAPKTEEP